MIITSKFPRFDKDPQPPFVFYFAKELVSLGHEVHVIAPHDKGAKHEETMEGVKIYRHQYFIPESMQKLSYGPGIPTNINKSILSAIQMPFFIISQILLSRKIAGKIKPDIVHAHWGFPQGLSAKLTGLPYVINFYGGELFPAKKFHMMWMLNYVVNKSCRSFTVTNYYVELMQKIGIKRKVEAIPLGVDVKTFYPDKKGAYTTRKKYCKSGELMVLFVGRLVERKGPNYLVEAFKEVLTKVPHARLVMVGGGPMDNELKKQASSLGISQNVTFCGEITNTELPRYYNAADVFVLPSIIDRHGDREGQGVVYLEAMACKTPVIGTNTGGIPDVIAKETGFLVEEKNPQELAGAIIKLLKDTKLRKKMGENAYNHVQKKFTWRSIAEKYVEIYEGCSR